MRREYRILLAALAGFAVLAVGTHFVNSSPANGVASSSLADSPATEPSNPTTSAVVADGSTTPISVTELSESLVSAPDKVAPETTLVPPSNNGCADLGHSAVIDRANQRTWLCNDGKVSATFVMTSAITQPDPGTYKVYAKDLNSSSLLTGKYSTMTHFVAFTYGKYTGARIAFHSIPQYSDGQYVQPLDSVGTAAKRGASSGCIRVLYDDSVRIWNWLAMGDPVIVIS
jgi:hypothetical protein